jgi:uncharacterized protein
MKIQTDVLVIGAGLAGLVAAIEAARRGRDVILIDQEGPQSIGGQAYWSLGGLFMVDTPEQRRIGIKDSQELAYSDWIGSAQFDRPEDKYPRLWAEKYIEFSSGSMREWLRKKGLKWFPSIGWAERGGGQAGGHGNSVPRFHLTWGTGVGVVEPFVAEVNQLIANRKIKVIFRYRATDLVMIGGNVAGITGEILAEDVSLRGQSTNRVVKTEFEILAENSILSSGGIGGNLELVKKFWPSERLGNIPKFLISGVPDYVDGKIQQRASELGVSLINIDRMWHYTEGIRNWNSIWPNHGIRILSGPSPMWFDALGDRLPAPCMPGFDTLETLKNILKTGYDYSWMILTQKIIEKEFVLSGSEQNPDFTSKSWLKVLSARLGKGAPEAIESFKKFGDDFVISDNLRDLVNGMNEKENKVKISYENLKQQITDRDMQVNNKFSKDAQIIALHGARKYLGDKILRTATPHKLLDSRNGPLIAIRLNILTRKSLGGIQTDLTGQALNNEGNLINGLFAAGEVAGFGGGGYHGYNALEGTFLGGCMFSGLIAGKFA